MFISSCALIYRFKLFHKNNFKLINDVEKITVEKYNINTKEEIDKIRIAAERNINMEFMIYIFGEDLI